MRNWVHLMTRGECQYEAHWPNGIGCFPTWFSRLANHVFWFVDARANER